MADYDIRIDTAQSEYEYQLKITSKKVLEGVSESLNWHVAQADPNVFAEVNLCSNVNTCTDVIQHPSADFNGGIIGWLLKFKFVNGVSSGTYNIFLEQDESLKLLNIQIEYESTSEGLFITVIDFPDGVEYGDYINFPTEYAPTDMFDISQFGKTYPSFVTKRNDYPYSALFSSTFYQVFFEDIHGKLVDYAQWSSGQLRVEIPDGVNNCYIAVPPLCFNYIATPYLITGVYFDENDVLAEFTNLGGIINGTIINWCYNAVNHPDFDLSVSISANYPGKYKMYDLATRTYVSDVILNFPLTLADIISACPAGYYLDRDISGTVVNNVTITIDYSWLGVQWQMKSNYFRYYR